MNGDADERAPLASCAGCAPEPTPEPISNRPGLPALQYRVGTWSSFVARMLAALPRQQVPVDGVNGAPVTPLAALNTRAPDDPSIALIDAFATAADVLTFYQERIANEGFLRTATERRSVLELARAVGYELSPGVAAGTPLAFTLDPSPGAPTVATIPAGTQVQSVPGPGQTPQTFETIQAATARLAWNVLRPRLQQPQSFEVHNGKLVLTDLDDTGVVASPNRLYVTGTATGLATGDTLLAVVGTSASAKTATVRVLSVTTDNVAQQTIIGIGPGDTPALPALPAPIFPPPATTGRIDTKPIPLEPATIRELIFEETWDEETLASFCAVQNWSPDALTALVAQELARRAPACALFAFRQKVGCFGHNAPLYAQVHQQPVPDPRVVLRVLGGFTPQSAADFQNQSDSMATEVADQLTWKPAPDPGDWDAHPRSIWTDDQGTSWFTTYGFDVFLERVTSNVVPGGWALFQAPGLSVPLQITASAEMSLNAFSLSGRATALGFGAGGQPAANENPDLLVRRTTAFVQSEALPLAPLPVVDVVQSAGAGAVALELDRMMMGFSVGQTLLLTGTPLGSDDTPLATWASEAVTLSAVIHHAGFTTLYFAQALRRRYVRSSVTLTANVVPATHGQTVAREILGGGDASTPLQSFTLHKAPLTWVSAPTATGRQSTLTVRVDDDAWTEVPSLYGQAPDARVYALQTEDDGTTSVLFGDGVSGARLPTGTFNVAATYRSGLGLVGQVPAGALTTLLSRPLGIRSVTNPLPATGAADPQSLDDARANAPTAMLTQGRIVSVRDYQGFVRAFAGVGKAQAAALWDGRRQLVSVTVAAADGTPLDPSSDLYASLAGGIAHSSDALEQVLLTGFAPRYFRVQARLVVDPAADQDAVLAAVQAALQSAFAFAQRDFGQPVTSAEVIAAIQSVSRVTAVEMQALVSLTPGGADQGSGVQPVLAAAPARWQNGSVALAELLTLYPTGIKLTAGTGP